MDLGSSSVKTKRFRNISKVTNRLVKGLVGASRLRTTISVGTSPGCPAIACGFGALSNGSKVSLPNVANSSFGTNGGFGNNANPGSGAPQGFPNVSNQTNAPNAGGFAAEGGNATGGFANVGMPNASKMGSSGAGLVR